jgi:hypothetical protein
LGSEEMGLLQNPITEFRVCFFPSIALSVSDIDDTHSCETNATERHFNNANMAAVRTSEVGTPWTTFRAGSCEAYGMTLDKSSMLKLSIPYLCLWKQNVLEKNT